MKKFSKYLALAVLSGCLISAQLTPAYAAGLLFKDVSGDFWGYAPIKWAVENKIVDGYPDGRFKPNQIVSQSEFLAMLIKAYRPADLKPAEQPSNWAAPYVDYAEKMGWGRAASSPQKTEPNHSPLSRGMAAKLLASASGKNFSLDDAILYAMDSGLVEGKTAKNLAGFKKNEHVTRAEAVALIQRMKGNVRQLKPSPAAEVKYAPERITYENPKYKFTLELPKRWEGKYKVVEAGVSSSNVENLHFVNVANEKEFGGILFTIQVMPKQEWLADKETAMSMRAGHIFEVGEKDKRTYLLVTPSDVQFAVNDQNLKAEYQSMFNDVENIKTTFKCKQ